MARSSVDLPAPLGPSTPSTSPGRTSKAATSSKLPRRTVPSKWSPSALRSSKRLASACHADPPPPTQRPRRANSTAIETASSTRDSASAASGSVSIAR